MKSRFKNTRGSKTYLIIAMIVVAICIISIAVLYRLHGADSRRQSMYRIEFALSRLQHVMLTEIQLHSKSLQEALDNVYDSDAYDASISEFLGVRDIRILDDESSWYQHANVHIDTIMIYTSIEDIGVNEIRFIGVDNGGRVVRLRDRPSGSYIAWYLDKSP